MALNYDGYTTANDILQDMDLTGRTILITGATTGIGYETAKSLAEHNAHVILACRNLEKAAKKKAEIIQDMKKEAQIDILECDLKSMKSVKRCAQQFIDRKWPLHVLILNAGSFAQAHTITEDSLEETLQVNHMAHFYLTRLLEPVLISSAPSRVVVLSSEAHRRAPFFDKHLTNIDDLCLEHLSPSKSQNYWYMHAYNLSKLINNCYMLQLHKMLNHKGINVTAVHPGRLIRTDIQRNSLLMRLLFLAVSPFTKTLQQGAATTVLCAVHPLYAHSSGLYLNNCQPTLPHKLCLNTKLQQKIWQLSEDFVNEFEHHSIKN